MNWWLALGIVSAVIVAAAAYPIMYAAGLGFSRGFHRGKREFVARLLKNRGHHAE